MRLLFILIVITILSEAKKRRLDKTRKKIDKLRPGEDGNRFVPVPFGHIFKDGFEPSGPVDLLELSSSYASKDSEIVKQLLEKGSKAILPVKKVSPQGFASPKDVFTFDNKKEIEPDEEEDIEESLVTREKPYLEQDEEEEPKKKNVNKKELAWQTLAAIQQRNIGMSASRIPHRNPQRNNNRKDDVPTLVERRKSGDPRRENYFLKSSFELEHKLSEESRYNWTTCEEFGKNAKFHPNDVVNIDWVPFYMWASKDLVKPFAYVHRFSIPTLKIVKQYKENLGPFIKKPLNWEVPKLHLKTDNEMLLLSVDRKGEFEALPYNEVPSSMKKSNIVLPTINLRLKIVKPFLAMMFCEYHYAIIMAVSGSLPNTVRGLRSKADSLKFKGRGYPVARDLKSEMFAAKREREEKRQEKEKFLEPDEQSYLGFF